MALTKKINLQNMQVGDYIPCRYTAASGLVGIFSELGTCVATDIPFAGTATPDGLFNFIKVDKGLLIADRVVQNSISWNTLNSSKMIEGRVIDFISVLNSSHNVALKNKLMDGKFSVATAPDWYGALTTTAWITFENANQIINSIKIASWYESGYEAIKDFVLYGANNADFSDAIVLTSATQPEFVTNYVEHSFSNTTFYKYFKLDILSIHPGNAGNNMGIQDIQFGTINSINLTTIRSLSGGNSFADINGNLSLTDQSKGAFPTTNEWDKYIVNSDLKGAITKGDDTIWHWNNNIYNICKETPVIGIAASDRRVIRGKTSINAFYGLNLATTTAGFRPVLEYLETDSKANTLFY